MNCPQQMLKDKIRLEVCEDPFDPGRKCVRATIWLPGDERRGGILKLPAEFRVQELKKVLDKAVSSILRTYHEMEQNDE